MDILFSDRKLEKQCNDMRLLQKRHGAQRAKLIGQRLYELHDAVTLGDMYTLPQARCHELKGGRRGQFSVDLDGPYRLIFEPYHDPVPVKDDGGIELSKITSVIILGVEDTHA